MSAGFIKVFWNKVAAQNVSNFQIALYIILHLLKSQQATVNLQAILHILRTYSKHYDIMVKTIS